MASMALRVPLSHLRAVHVHRARQGAYHIRVMRTLFGVA